MRCMICEGVICEGVICEGVMVRQQDSVPSPLLHCCVVAGSVSSEECKT